jgi:hypothetical protein
MIYQRYDSKLVAFPMSQQAELGRLVAWIGRDVGGFDPSLLP